MTSPHALVEREGHVLVVTMNRPVAKNALSAADAASTSEAA
jgi:enoyl-CoA hydratase